VSATVSSTVSRTIPSVALLALLALLALATSWPARVLAQEVPVRAAGFVVDSTRLRSWDRSQDMIVHVGDSAVLIGRRRVTMSPTSAAGGPAWLMVESRTGAVPAAESLHVSGMLVPVRWTSQLGRSQLTFQFARDSAFGGTTGPGGRQSVIIPVPADLVVSTAMAEAVLSAAPLGPDWRDSISVLRIDHAGTGIVAGELVVIGEEYEGAPAWIVALRAGGKSVLFWIDRETGGLTRLQQLLPLHVGSMLEYRSVASTPDSSSTPPP
jgi:hypothetical protein